MSGFMIIRDIMIKNIKTVKPDDTVHAAVKKMNKFDIGSVIVVSSGRPIGIITETNIMRRIVEPRNGTSKSKLLLFFRRVFKQVLHFFIG